MLAGIAEDTLVAADTAPGDMAAGAADTAAAAGIVAAADTVVAAVEGMVVAVEGMVVVVVAADTVVGPGRLASWKIAPSPLPKSLIGRQSVTSFRFSSRVRGGAHSPCTYMDARSTGYGYGGLDETFSITQRYPFWFWPVGLPAPKGSVGYSVLKVSIAGRVIFLRYMMERQRNSPGALMKVSVIIPAAGLGTRMGRATPEKEGISRKQFMLLNGSPILLHTIRKFVSSPLVTEIVVALRGDDLIWAQDLFAQQGFAKTVRVTEGGETRQQSVENALSTISGDTDLVAVHDAVRPFIEIEVIEKVIREAGETGAAIVGIVPVDTVKQVHRNKVRATLPRERLILTQTPQVFRLSLLRTAFEKAREDLFVGTDESSLVERLEQVEVSVVAGTDRNIKITKPSDMELARLYWSFESSGLNLR